MTEDTHTHKHIHIYKCICICIYTPIERERAGGEARERERERERERDRERERAGEKARERERQRLPLPPQRGKPPPSELEGWSLGCEPFDSDVGFGICGLGLRVLGCRRDFPGCGSRVGGRGLGLWSED
jgi:hypothetical protein